MVAEHQELEKAIYMTNNLLTANIKIRKKHYLRAMIGALIMIINTENGIREILLCPIMLQSKNPLADIKDRKFTKLFFYEHWMDEAYKANLNGEYLPEDFKTEKYLINYGQDFSKYYLGYINVDLDNKTYGIPEDHADKMDILHALGDLYFDEHTEPRLVIIMTPTRPSDIHI